MTLPLWPDDHVHKMIRITFRDYSWRQCFACGASTWHQDRLRRLV